MEHGLFAPSAALIGFEVYPYFAISAYRHIAPILQTGWVSQLWPISRLMPAATGSRSANPVIQLWFLQRRLDVHFRKYRNYVATAQSQN